MPNTTPPQHLYIGLMSGTSLDGVDGAIASFDPGPGVAVRTLGTSYIPFPSGLRDDLLALQSSGENEIHRESLAANALAGFYADCVTKLLETSLLPSSAIKAIAVHGQTIRHRPELGYTRQTGNPALLAELTGIDVIADFRSRDIAAGGQGAPLVPAFHQAAFGNKDESRVVANIGGIGNISILSNDDDVIGFDTGPGNVLMDAWICRHQDKAYDSDGAWARSGQVLPELLQLLCAEPYLDLPPPKSTGRDLFNIDWLMSRLVRFGSANAADVQATLTAFTATTLADAIHRHAPQARAIYVCGGGAFNSHLMQQIAAALHARGNAAVVESTERLGVSPNHVEALAFAWLAHRFISRLPGNLPAVTGARGPRILGALYPAA
ncbi:MAG TPA: anhydro-N-acetylmuramic acid kinase [Noviherbaspirillum sp.]|jgi:anhydro-N-acetylmuramic acid kinase|uniref:anhydro-N-acetylmuramic acid kinase n=1 Tax=Noviherbaspirillum sp. TaxID=1926288 RepID=UPI002DDCA88D|nr:anhydro-N-acetylmuramic acid kinase [Noviherbaspirillum sp.]HEV2612460.1 anhydro-N-acetylmuramic acid kinase [Noviherbaspirillum sp.]